MKIKRFWIKFCLLLLILALLISGICIHVWWHSPGVHVLGDRASVKIYDTAYAINFTSGEIIEQVDVVIDGNVKGHEFDGYIDVEGHHISLESLKSEDSEMGGSVHNDTIEIDYHGGNLFETLWIDGKIEMRPTDTREPWYDVSIDIDTEEYVIEITMADACLIVSADSAEAAKGRYDEYMAKIID